MKGVLRKNNKTKETQPDWRGDATIFGDQWDVGAWIKPNAEGQMFMSLQLSHGPESNRTKFNAGLYKNKGKSDERPWDYSGHVTGRKDIEIFGTNVRVNGEMTCQLRFDGDLPLLDKVTDVSGEVEEEIPF